MNPLIKWPGGKSREFEMFKEYIPPFDRYIEPFFGGGAVYFKIMPTRSIINDLSEDLVKFYKLIQEENVEFKEYMYDYVSLWETVSSFFQKDRDNLEHNYYEYRDNKLPNDFITVKLKNLDFYRDFTHKLIKDQFHFNSQIEKNILSKMTRMRKLEATRGLLPSKDIHDNIETSIRSGVYMYFRDIYNNINLEMNINSSFRSANYFFIREFCYASMFRFNKQGEFNIPYGGMAYNKKNLRLKVDNIFDKNTINLLNNTEIFNNDFEDILKLSLKETDFIFLDPPYDSEFSEYERNAFTQLDQMRLAKSLYLTKARFLMIIKNTPFIRSLYEGKEGIYIDSFDKKYMYNVKGRNIRDVQHLIITNYNLNRLD